MNLINSSELQSTSSNAASQTLWHELPFDLFHIVVRNETIARNEAYRELSPEQLDTRLKADINHLCCTKRAVWYLLHIYRLSTSGPGWKLKALDLLLLLKERVKKNCAKDPSRTNLCDCYRYPGVRMSWSIRSKESEYSQHLAHHLDVKARKLLIQSWKDPNEAYDPYQSGKDLLHFDYETARKQIPRNPTGSWIEGECCRTEWTLLYFIPRYTLRLSIVAKILEGKLPAELFETVLRYWIGNHKYGRYLFWLHACEHEKSHLVYERTAGCELCGLARQ